MKKEVVEKLAVLITGAFGLIAALAWNGAIQAIFKTLLGDPNSLTAMIIYAVIITIIAVIATLWISGIQARMAARLEKRK